MISTFKDLESGVEIHLFISSSEPMRRLANQDWCFRGDQVQSEMTQSMCFLRMTIHCANVWYTDGKNTDGQFDYTVFRIHGITATGHYPVWCVCPVDCVLSKGYKNCSSNLAWTTDPLNTRLGWCEREKLNIMKRINERIELRWVCTLSREGKIVVKIDLKHRVKKWTIGKTRISALITSKMWPDLHPTHYHMQTHQIAFPEVS